MQPLQMKSTSKKYMKQNEQSKTASKLQLFRPFSSFTSRTVSRLKETTEWLVEKESQVVNASQIEQISNVNESYDLSLEAVDSRKKGIILSLTNDQIRALVINFVMKIGARRGASNVRKDNSGGTLIVLRDKDDIESWEHQLRENTSFSVWTHIKKGPKTSLFTLQSRLAGYDIVLTTFDAIKSKDVTQPVDKQGQSMTQKLVGNDGWYTKDGGGMSSSNPHTKCLHLSVAHGIRWTKVMFIDKIGKSCYITKPKTSRAIAAKALVGRSR